MTAPSPSGDPQPHEPDERTELRHLILKVIAKRVGDAERVADEIVDEIEAADLTISNNNVIPIFRGAKPHEA